MLQSQGEDWSLAQKMAAQQELLGVSLEAHPLELLALQIEQAGAVSSAEAAERIGDLVTVAGVHVTSRRNRTSRGEPMLYLTLEDMHGVLDVVLFPEVYRQARRLVSAQAPFLVIGRMERHAERDAPLLRAEKVIALE